MKKKENFNRNIYISGSDIFTWWYPYYYHTSFAKRLSGSRA